MCTAWRKDTESKGAFMDKAEFRVKFRGLLEEVGSGILATNGIDGSPSLRFVTPVPLERDFSTIYCLSIPILIR
jgi:hypothetical protein